MAKSRPRPAWRAALPAVLLPTFVFNIGQGALLPVLPAIAVAAGAPLAHAAFTTAALLIGKLVASLPSGAVVDRFGERNTMRIGAAVSVFGSAALLVSQHPAMIMAGSFVTGCGATAFNLARHAYLTTNVPAHFRARAMSLLIGANRLGTLLGPFVGAAVAYASDDARVVAVVPLAVGVGLTALTPELPETRQSDHTTRNRSVDTGVLHTLVERRRDLARMGPVALLISGLRASRTTLVPLVAVSIGMSPAQTSLVIGWAAAIDFALFYAGGVLMDRYSRRIVGTVAMTGFCAAHAGLAIAAGHSEATPTFVLATLSLALANGITSGIIATLGADLADPDNPAPFLGAWRLISNTGTATSPVLIGVITTATTLTVSAATMGTLALLAAIAVATSVTT